MELLLFAVDADRPFAREYDVQMVAGTIPRTKQIAGVTVFYAAQREKNVLCLLLMDYKTAVLLRHI